MNNEIHENKCPTKCGNFTENNFTACCMLKLPVLYQFDTVWTKSGMLPNVRTCEDTCCRHSRYLCENISKNSPDLAPTLCLDSGIVKAVSDNVCTYEKVPVVDWLADKSVVNSYVKTYFADGLMGLTCHFEVESK